MSSRQVNEPAPGDRLERDRIDEPRSGNGVERERIGIHNEAETNRRDRIRWGPIWAGIVTAIGAYLILQLALIAVGVVELGEGATDDTVASAVAALVAFFLGGVVAGATAMWRGVDDGVLHGVVMWFAAIIALVLLSIIGSGVALGAFDTTKAIDAFSVEGVDIAQARDDAQDAAGKALAALVAGLVASAIGGAVGAKMWPKDDVFLEVSRNQGISARR